MKYVYLVKNLSPWMINEIHAFSRFVPFRLILLRKPEKLYKDDLSKLSQKGVEILIQPFIKFPRLRKILFTILFIIRHAHCFLGVKNFVFGIKSVGWFLLLDDKYLKGETSIHAQFATQASIIALMYKEYIENINYSFTFHAHDIFFNNRWFKNLVKKAQIVFSISNYNIEYVKKKYKNLDITKIRLSRLGVSPPLQRDLNDYKKKGQFTIGFLSWWEEKKGLLILLDSITKLVSNKKFSLSLLLAGDGPLKKRVLDFVKKNGLERIVYFHGIVYGKKKKKFFESIDLFVLPSIFTKNDMDGIPVVLMEAISYGIPIVSSNISGIPEICEDNYNGFLVPAGDKKALIKAIENFYYMDDETYQQFRLNALKSSLEYDIVTNSKKKLELLGWNN